MRLHKIYILFYSLSCSLIADVHYLTVINKINSGDLIQSPQLSCPEDHSLAYLKITSSLSHSQLINQCAIDLCGKPGDNPSAWVLDTNFSSSIPKESISKANALTPILKKMFKDAAKEQLDITLQMRDFSNNSMVKIRNMSSINKNELAKKFFEPYIIFTIIKNSPLSERIQLKFNLPENASPELIDSLQSYSNNLKKEMLENPSFTEFQTAFQEEDLKAIAQNKFNELSFLKQFPIEEKEFKDILNTNPFNRLTYAQFYNQLISYREKIKQNQPLLCDISACDTAMINFFSSQKIKDQINDYENLLKSPEIIERSIARCKAKVIAEDMKMTSQVKAQNLFNKARLQVLDRIVPQYSNHSQQLIKTYLLTKLSGSHYDLKKSFNNRDPFTSLKNEIEAHNRVKGSLIPFERENFYAEKILQQTQSQELIYPFDNLSPCSSIGSNVWDNFFPAYTKKENLSKETTNHVKKFAPNDTVFVSDFSCQHAQNGIHNITHEIGHALNSLFLSSELSSESLKKYIEMRSCAASLYPNAPLSKIAHSAAGDKTTTEEDVADLIAFRSLMNEKKIYSCAHLKPSNINSGYQELAFFVNDSENVHSSSITRSLQEAFQKDIPIPQSCLKSIEHEKSNFRFKKCM